MPPFHLIDRSLCATLHNVAPYSAPAGKSPKCAEHFQERAIRATSSSLSKLIKQSATVLAALITQRSETTRPLPPTTALQILFSYAAVLYLRQSLTYALIFCLAALSSVGALAIQPVRPPGAKPLASPQASYISRRA